MKKHRDFNFLTGSERFLCNLEKQFFLKLFDFSENLQKSIKSDVSDTNGRQNRVFQVRTIQNELEEVICGDRWRLWSCSSKVIVWDFLENGPP